MRNYYDFKWDYTDEKTWDLLSSGKTSAIFQLESAGMQQVAQRLQPRNIEELCALISLYRPDTMGEIEHYINRKFGKEEVVFKHELLKDILGETYGCLIYQEQMMNVTKVFGGFSDGEADVFRKALGKKKPALIKEQVEKFIKRATENGFNEELVTYLGEWLVDKGGYCFNKSHGICYALPCFRTGYLKANYPVEFMCSVLNNQKNPQTGQIDYEGVSKFISECKTMGITINYPDVNKSDIKFIPKDGEIYFGLSLIKGLSSSIVDKIIALRPFESLLDFQNKCDPDSTSIVSLIKSGAFDTFNKNRYELLKEIAEIRYDLGKLSKGNLTRITKNDRQMLYSIGYIENLEEEKDVCLSKINFLRKAEQTNLFLEKYAVGDEKDWEFESLSFFLSGTPIDDIIFPNWEIVKDEESGYLAGTIIAVSKKKIKSGANKGKEMAFLDVESNFGKAEVTVFNKTWVDLNGELKTGKTLVFFGRKSGDTKMLLRGIIDLDTYKEGLKNGQTQTIRGL